MATRKVHWTEEDQTKPEPTRKRSDRQEKRLTKQFGGRQTPNSGAVFGENDVRSAQFDIEAKTTDGEGYRITAAELRQTRKKCRAGRIPLQIIEFAKSSEEYIIISTADFFDLCGIDIHAG